MKLETLKKRAEFLRVRGGARHACSSFVLEMKPQEDVVRAQSGPRFGFTVTKALGNAVRRNRIRRRLKAAVTAVAATHAKPASDYVVIARDGAFARPFEGLRQDFERAIARVHDPNQPARNPGRKPGHKKGSP